MGRKTEANRVQEVCCKQQRRLATNPNDSFLNNLNIGDPDASKHKRGFTDAEDIVDWFKIDRPDDWRQRD